jgi:hypothetical protein
MNPRRERGQDEGSARDARPESRPQTPTSAPGTETDAEGAEAAWAPAGTGGGVVSLDEGQFEALVRPFRKPPFREPGPPSA